jgi:hypothetical protein
MRRDLRDKDLQVGTPMYQWASQLDLDLVLRLGRKFTLR